MIKHRLIKLLIMCLCISLVLVGCGEEKENENKIISGSNITPFAKKTNQTHSSDGKVHVSGVLMSVNTASKRAVVADMDDGNMYEITYSGGTDIRDRYDSVIAASQLQVGVVYEFACDGNGKADKIMPLKSAWSNSGITAFDIDLDAGTLKVGSGLYKLADNFVCLSLGEKIMPQEVIGIDEITINGKDKVIYSIVVDKGHSYVELTGVTAFLDGYVAIADKTVLPVSLNMLVTVPEGESTITLQKGDIIATKKLNLGRNATAIEDFSEYQQQAVKTGTVKLNIIPKDAVLRVDGNVKDHTQPFNVSYGTHTISIIADGYSGYSGRMVIASETFSKDIVLSAEAATEASTEASLTGGYYVRVNAPTGVAVYVDSAYVGIAPVAIEKKAGTRVVTLTKEGYESKSYSINITNTAGDVKYEFPELIPTVKTEATTVAKPTASTVKATQ